MITILLVIIAIALLPMALAVIWALREVFLWLAGLIVVGIMLLIMAPGISDFFSGLAAIGWTGAFILLGIFLSFLFIVAISMAFSKGINESNEGVDEQLNENTTIEPIIKTKPLLKLCFHWAILVFFASLVAFAILGAISSSTNIDPAISKYFILPLMWVSVWIFLGSFLMLVGCFVAIIIRGFVRFYKGEHLENKEMPKDTATEAQNKMKKPTAWSYSALSLFEQCPFKYKCAKIDKLHEPKSDALQLGIDIHKSAEDYFNHELEDVPKSCIQFAELFEAARDLGAVAEGKWAFNKRWMKTGFFDKDVYARGVCDLVLLYPEEKCMDIIDFKTGKYYETNKDQVELFAMTALLLHPEIEYATPRLWYLDSGKEIICDKVAQVEVPILGANWAVKADKLLSAEEYPMRANRFCNWCHFRKDNGGPCKLTFGTGLNVKKEACGRLPVQFAPLLQ